MDCPNPEAMYVVSPLTNLNGIGDNKTTETERETDKDKDRERTREKSRD